MIKSIIFCFIIGHTLGFNIELLNIANDYVSYKRLKYVTFIACKNNYHCNIFASSMIKQDVRVSVAYIDDGTKIDLYKVLLHPDVAVGIVLDGTCDGAQGVLEKASHHELFDTLHPWLVLTNIVREENETGFISNTFTKLSLSVNTDVTVVEKKGDHYTLTDVYNFGKIQGNQLEKVPIGVWRKDTGLDIMLSGYKYYNRWNFHNLTLRAVSVMLEIPKIFSSGLLEDTEYTPGVAVFTKITSQLLKILKEQHNFRFNYTIADRWIGSPIKNSTLAVSNSLFWEEQDLSSTSARIFPEWYDWVNIIHPPTTNLQTKIYYLIPNKGVGEYENRFLTPMSGGVWLCSLAACVACVLVLSGACWTEDRPEPGIYSLFSVFAIVCQDAYDDGVQLTENKESQGHRMTLMVVGIMSMLLYNYYTSSVVSWLLNAATPSIQNLDGLINSDFELVFEDIGYTRGWLDNPGFFYYSGFKNLKEDELREKKVTNAKRTVAALQPVNKGLQLVRTGKYAFHTEPYTASQVISKTYEQEELCNLGTLQMMLPAHVYIMVQRHSPYKEFLDWSMLRLTERGHVTAVHARFAGTIPPCSGIKPRALSLGQAAPAFLLLFVMTILSWMICAFEILVHKRALIKCTHEMKLNKT